MSVTPPRKRSLFGLIGDLPGLVMDLVRNEIEQLKQEMIGKAKHAGIGIGILAGAATLLFFALAVLIAAAVLGLGTVLPAWAAALIVGGAILLIAGLLVVIGLNQLKQGKPTPEKTIESVQQDVKAIKGTGKRATS